LGLTDSALFASISGGERMLHGLYDFTLPPQLLPLATATERVIGFRHAQFPLYALQYPIEHNDPDGAQLLYNFAVNLCACRADWDEDLIIDHAVAQIRRTAQAGDVLCAVSGGVDSAVCAKLAQLAVGERLICVFVDTGLFRLDETQSVISGFMDTMGLVVAYVDAKEAFLHALSGVTSAADKERIASSLMTQILLKQLTFAPDIHTLVMGTNLNDVLYGFMPSAQIDEAKGDAELCACEPIRDLFKEEVRRIARALNLPASLAERQPFPASGLALRIMGKVTEERLSVLRAADACFAEEIHNSGFEKRLWQYYASLVETPDQPDSYSICLRALQAGQSVANAARLAFDLLERTTERILREVHGINRVVYDLTPGSHYMDLE
ncbi:MAG: GMP synthase (glutamine-hydrolyzing), partial [Clostridia bacterium]